MSSKDYVQSQRSRISYPW